jgi:hypothetical protein
VSDKVVSFAFLIFGLILMIYRKQVARIAVEQQYSFFGFKVDENLHRYTFAFGGLILALIGIASLLGLIKFGD